MDLVSGYKGVVELVFGNEKSGSSNEDSYVERLLDCISNGKLAEDKRTAMLELQSVVAESSAAQLAFGAMGFPVMMGILREERDDVEMILLRETMGFDPLMSILKLRGSTYSFTQEKHAITRS